MTENHTLPEQVTPIDKSAEGVVLPQFVRPWVGKLHHSRELMDDWGSIRDEAGLCILMVRIPPDENDAGKLNQHRRQNTDPTQKRVDAILALLNGPNAQDQTREPKTKI